MQPADIKGVFSRIHDSHHIVVDDGKFIGINENCGRFKLIDGEQFETNTVGESLNVERFDLLQKNNIGLYLGQYGYPFIQ